MNSHVTARFRKNFESLPQEIQDKAKRAYTLWTDNPNHPSLHFNKYTMQSLSILLESDCTIAHLG